MRISKHHFRDIRVSVFVSSVSYLTRKFLFPSAASSEQQFFLGETQLGRSYCSVSKLGWRIFVADLTAIPWTELNIYIYNYVYCVYIYNYVYIYVYILYVYIYVYIYMHIYIRVGSTYIYVYVECIASSSLVASLLTYCDKLETSESHQQLLCAGNSWLEVSPILGFNKSQHASTSV
jgi:hypothetical protein